MGAIDKLLDLAADFVFGRRENTGNALEREIRKPPPGKGDK
jgi:hypothetical protein